MSEGKVIDQIGHPDCGSSDALKVYEKDNGRIDGYCFSCNKWVKDPYGTSSEPPVREREREVNMSKLSLLDVQEYPMGGLPHRGLRDDIGEWYGIRLGVSEEDGETIEDVFYPLTKDGDIVAYKRRTVAEKRFSTVGRAKGVEFFGQVQAYSVRASKRLYITEGEDDCMIVFQALLDSVANTKWAHLTPAVVSLPTGATSAARVLSEQMEFLDTFDEIVLVFDQDKPGQAAVEAALKILPLERVFIARLPMKDPCEMYEAGREEELIKSIKWKPSRPRLATVMKAEDLIEDVMDIPPPGPDWPWESLTKITHGIRPKEIIGVGAGVGVGKSSFWHETQAQLSLKARLGCGLFMLEEPNPKTLRKLAGKYSGRDFGKLTEENKEALVDAVRSIPDNLCVYSHRGTKDWGDVRQAIRHMVVVEGVRFIFVDPLTALVAHLSSGEANDALNAIFSEIATMVEALDFTFLYGAHLNPPKTGAPHEEGGRVMLSQFTGSKAMIKWSTLIFGLERNTQAEDADERNSVTVRILKDREEGQTGWTTQLQYIPESGKMVSRSTMVDNEGAY